MGRGRKRRDEWDWTGWDESKGGTKQESCCLFTRSRSGSRLIWLIGWVIEECGKQENNNKET